MIDNDDTITVSAEEPRAAKTRIQTHGIKYNGISHRKNKPRKDAQHRKNMAIRAALYQERGRISAAEWHTRLNALSLGTT